MVPKIASSGRGRKIVVAFIFIVAKVLILYWRDLLFPVGISTKAPGFVVRTAALRLAIVQCSGIVLSPNLRPKIRKAVVYIAKTVTPLSATVHFGKTIMMGAKAAVCTTRAAARY
jgi:hypothetical protein